LGRALEWASSNTAIDGSLAMTHAQIASNPFAL